MGFNDRRGGFGGGRRDGGRGFGGRGGGFGRDRGFGGRDRGPVEMHAAVCGKCGKKCEVPFKPTAGKQVLCSDCFSSAGGSRRDMNSSGGGMSQEQFNKLDSKLNKILDILKDIEVVGDEEDMDDEDDDDELADDDDSKVELIEDDDSEDDSKVELIEDEAKDEEEDELNDNSEDKPVA